MSPECRRALWASTGLLLIVSMAPTARAQSVDSPAPRTQQLSQVEEVVVTAQRRAENMQRVAVAVTAFTAKTLQARQLNSVTDIAQTAPNVQYSAGTSGTGSASNIFIRGIGQYDFVTTADPGVGTYLDGVYLARTTGAALDLGDVERVEVLYGPQGTLFGRNSIGGAINITTQQPTNNLSGQIEGAVGNLGRYEERLMLNLPLVDDKLALRINAFNTQNDGYGDATLSNCTSACGGTVRLGAQKEFAGRAELLAKPTNTLQVLLSVDGTHSRGTTDPVSMVAWSPYAPAATYNAIPGVVPIGPSDVTTNLNDLHYSVDPKEDLDVFGASLTLTQQLGDITLKSITAYRWQGLASGQDYSGTAAEYLNQAINQTGQQISQEFQVLGKSFGGQLTWVAGLYYFTESDTFDSDITEALPAPTPIGIFIANGTQSYAGYAQATYHLTNKWSLTAGIRYTDERKTITATTDYGGFIPTGPNADGADIVGPNAARAVSYSATSPKGAIQYQATDNIMAYASISRGFRSGGFNGRPFSAADLAPYAPETTTSYEIGIKSEWLDRRLRLNLAGYYTDYANIQLTAVETEPGGELVVVTGNAASAKIYGFEMNFEARPTEALTLFGGLGETNDTVVNNPGFSIQGNTLPDAPKTTANLGFEYQQPLGEWGAAALNVEGNYRSSSTPLFQATPSPDVIAGYALLNAQISFTPRAQPWKFTLYGKNLTDTQYWVFAETTGLGPTIAWFGRPREFGAKAAYDF